MDNIISIIDREIELSRKELADTTVKLVNIKSDLELPSPGAPFGKGVRKVLDTVLGMGRENGFYPTDHGSGVISVAYKDAPADLGIWVHGDVVPAGSGWSFEPYDAVEYEGRIIGRGAADNKGQLSAIFVLLKIFKKLGVELNYNPALFVGSHEEKGMYDLLGIEGNDDAKGFLNTCTPPKLSLVPDGAFPIGYGGKGNFNIKLKTKKALHGLKIYAGQDDAPGKACAIFDNSTLHPIETFSPPVHTAHPDPNGNMITKLAEALLASPNTSDGDRRVFEFLKKISSDIDGKMFGIDVETKTMKPLILTAHRIDDLDGFIELSVNIRNPIEISSDEIKEKISAVADGYGFTVSGTRIIHNPYLLDKNAPIVTKLCEISNSVTGDDKEPYTLGGGTYAHELPNAYVFGSSSNLRPDSWDKGRGGAHGIDEAVSLDRLQRAMRIYARALLALNDMEW